MFRALAALLVSTAVYAVAADVRGSIHIVRNLTRRNVTLSASPYQRGPTVSLGADPATDPLDYERSHVAVYLEGVLPDGNRQDPSKRGADAAIEQRHRRFTPDLVVIPAGASVSFPNFDPIFHNVFSLSSPKNFDLGNYPMGSTRVVFFTRPGVVAVYCHLHPNMAATIVVAPSRWAVRASENGDFRLPNVPPGAYTVIAWHKAAGAFRKPVQVTAGRDTEVDFTLPYVEPGGPALAKR
jgi:plastocyanin